MYKCQEDQTEPARGTGGVPRENTREALQQASPKASPGEGIHLCQCCRGTKQAVIGLLTCDRSLVASHPSVTRWQTDARETSNHKILIWGVYQVHNADMHITVDFKPWLAGTIPKYSATGSHPLPPPRSALMSCSGGLAGTE